MRLREITQSTIPSDMLTRVRIGLSIPVSNKNVEAFKKYYSDMPAQYREVIKPEKIKNRLVYKIFVMVLNGPIRLVRQATFHLFEFLIKHAWSEMNRTYMMAYRDHAMDEINKAGEKNEKDQAAWNALHSDRFRAIFDPVGNDDETS